MEPECEVWTAPGISGRPIRKPKPHPEEPVYEEEPKPPFALTPEHGDLVPKGDKFKFQRDAAANTEREQGNEGGENCDHAHNGMAVARKSPAFLGLSVF